MLLALTLTVDASPRAPATTHAGATPPNIVLVLADDLGYGELGCYGQQRIRTPRIDAFASRALRFTDAYAGSPVCAPSRCVLLTGMASVHAAIRDNKEVQPEGQYPLPADARTLAELLKARGYATAAVGKWGLGPWGSSGDPLTQGFDHFYGYICQRHAHNHYPAYLYRDGKREALPGNPESPTRGDQVGQTYAPDLFREEAIKFIKARRDEPFFLYFATPVPHLALQAPAEAVAMGESMPDKPYDGKKGYLPHEKPHAAYAGMVSRLDQDFGAIVDAIGTLPPERDTLIIFTSDNGPTFDVGGADSTFFDSTAGLRGRKMDLYEGGVRVPLIIGFASGGVRGESDRLVGSWDLMPTITSLAGAATPDGIDGLPIRELVPGAPSHEWLSWEFPSGGGWQAVRLGQYKAVRRNLKKNPDAPIELYDLTTDRAEKSNIASQHPEIVERVRSIMAQRSAAALPEWNVVAE